MDEMRDMLTFAESDLALHPESNDLPDAMIEDAINWLDNIKRNEYKAAKKIRTLMPEDRWKKYEAWGFEEDFQEVKAWREKLSVLKGVLKNRPDFFKRKACDKIINNQIKARKHEHKNHEHGNQDHKRDPQARGHEINQPAV